MQEKISVVINNYNYAKYLTETVVSIFEQSLPVYEIIIVDDGSTDNSLDVIKGLQRKDSRVVVIAQANQGQLSAILNGCAAAKGDILCLLDADDIYERTYLQEVARDFGANKNVDMRFCDVQEFGNQTAVRNYVKYYGLLGETTLCTYLTNAFFGNVTSSISLRKSMMEKLTPYLKKYEADWITRADNCIIWGVSLAGGVKFNSSDASVKYRIHGENLYSNNKKSTNTMKYVRAREFFIRDLADELNLEHHLIRWLYKEYLTFPLATAWLKKQYVRSIWKWRNDCSIVSKLGQALNLELAHIKLSKRR